MNRKLHSAKSVQAFDRMLIAALLVFAAACETTKNNDAGDALSSSDANWKIVQAYIELDTAWHTKNVEIYRADHPIEERDRLLEEERGDHPDIVLAVGAAKAIIESKGDRVLEAAEFLVEHPGGLSPTEEQDIEFGMVTLKSIVGPDWSVVEDYTAQRNEWQKKLQEIRDSELTPDEKIDRTNELGQSPKGTIATVAAIAVAEEGAAHEKSRAAAEFLIQPGRGAPEPNAAVQGAVALAKHFPNYDNWSNVLSWLDYMRPWDASGRVREFTSDMAANSSDSVVRATARYFAGAALMDDLNKPSFTPEQRDEMRNQALEYVTGLSLGVEDEAFVREISVDSDLVTHTLAEMEATLIHGIRHATIGGTLADEVGRRLDGSEENLSAYSGKMVLLDFWATWCGPCVGVLPELRELASTYPEDRFEILAISVDDEVDTVIEFMEGEPMSWAQWHIGPDSVLVRTWQIRAYPTYVVVDENGVILGRSSSLSQTNELIGQTL